MAALSVGLGRYDRTQALLDGRVRPSGLDIAVSSPPLEELFARSFDRQEFDVSELSLSNFLVLSAAGRCAYAALPVFPSRMFRHSAVYVRSDRGIRSAEDLVGRVIGIREYSNTATLTAKGFLADEYGVRATDIAWRYGPVDVDDEPPRIRSLPEGIDIEPIPAGSNLSDMLLAGGLDGIISYRPPRCFADAHPSVARLFPDHRAAEEAYFRKTGIFPIMHVVGIRRELLDRSIGRALCAAFEEAKRIALRDLGSYQALAVSLPWAPAELSRTREVLGHDPWPYGLEANGRALEAALRWAREQGLIERNLDIGELFAPDVLDWEPPR